MASIRLRKETSTLMLDFTYKGQRCREQTSLPDTPANRTRLQGLLKRIKKAIAQGEFTYAEFFPDSPRAALDALTPTEAAKGFASSASAIPTFAAFAEVWYAESVPRWRKRYRESIRDTLNKIFYPVFSKKRLNAITRADLLAFRAEVAKRPGHFGQTLSAKRINKLMMQLRAIINEGCDRYGVPSPARGIKPLKQKRVDVLPFSLQEVELLIRTIRDDYRPYITVRCFTGLRTGEANGLQWSDIDFACNTMRVERTVSRDGDDDVKTDFSKREIPMVPQVRAAMEEQKARARAGCSWVFHTPTGAPIDAVNFTNRVWYPLLRYLGLTPRRPYQMRHTAATLMLASGENPEWIAKVLGHSTTEMLFRVYSRFVPNLTRQDGRAFAGLLSTHSVPAPSPSPSTKDIEAMDAEALRRELKAALAAQSRGPPRAMAELG